MPGMRAQALRSQIATSPRRLKSAGSPKAAGFLGQMQYPALLDLVEHQRLLVEPWQGRSELTEKQKFFQPDTLLGDWR